MVVPADDPAPDAAHILIRISEKKQSFFQFDLFFYKFDEMLMISSKTLTLICAIQQPH